MKTFYQQSIGYVTPSPPSPPAPPSPPPTEPVGGIAPAPATGQGGSNQQVLVAVLVSVLAGVILLAVLAFLAVWALKRSSTRGPGPLLPPGEGPLSTLLVTDVERSTGVCGALLACFELGGAPSRVGPR